MKPPDGKVPVMLELLGMCSTSLLTSLPGPLKVVAPDRVLSMGQIELCNYAKLNCLKLTVFTFKWCYLSGSNRSV